MTPKGEILARPIGTARTILAMDNNIYKVTFLEKAAPLIVCCLVGYFLVIKLLALRMIIL